MSDDALAPRGVTSLAMSPREDVREARRALELARLRVVAQLGQLEERLAPTMKLVEEAGRAIRKTAAVRQRVKEAVRRHPALALGGALLVGYGVARLLFRR